MKIYFMILIFSMFAFSGETIMAEPISELVLQSTIEPDREMKTIDLYSEENSLGNGGLQRIMEGKITIGEPTIKYIPRKQPTQGPVKWDYYSINTPFTLHRLDGNRYYELAVFQVTLKEPLSIANDLFPKDIITVETRIKKALSISSDFKFSFKVIEAGLGGKGEGSLEYIVLTPLITPFGKGEKQFYWEHKEFNEQHVFPGVKQAAVILQVPHGLKHINVDLEYKAYVVETLFGMITKRKSKTDTVTVNWELSK